MNHVVEFRLSYVFARKKVQGEFRHFLNAGSEAEEIIHNIARKTLYMLLKILSAKVKVLL